MLDFKLGLQMRQKRKVLQFETEHPKQIII